LDVEGKIYLKPLELNVIKYHKIPYKATVSCFMFSNLPGEPPQISILGAERGLKDGFDTTRARQMIGVLSIV
jgi:hypothetical protein